jgi:hypothetical protein
MKQSYKKKFNLSEKPGFLTEVELLGAIADKSPLSSKSGSADHRKQSQQHQRPNECLDNFANEAARINSQKSQQNTAQDSANDANDNVPNNTKAAALRHLASQPTGNQTD